MLKFKEEDFIKYVKESFSIAEVGEKLGFPRTGGFYKRFKKEVQRLNLDISHFTGQHWARGKTILTEKRLKTKYSLQEIFCENSNVSRSHVRSLIIKNKLILYECNECKISKWKNNPIVLDLEHKNGVRNDHRLENLTFLCPNCHSQTSSFRGKD